MKLYVCWGTFGGDWHHCQKAHTALTEAGHDPEVVKVHGWGVLPDVFNRGREQVVELTGDKWVPVLVTDSGEVVNPTNEIIAWAKANPVGAAPASA